jgi:murein DD-endopeptidase MepM/ murein hydrolase activator NlpD
VDIAAAPGQPVRASADGIVVEAGEVNGLGRAVYVAHGFGVTTRYGHMSRIDVRPGQRVKRGDIVGRVGNTGRSTGYHLHYEVRVDGDPVNPLAYILDDTAAGSS